MIKMAQLEDIRKMYDSVLSSGVKRYFHSGRFSEQTGTLSPYPWSLAHLVFRGDKERRRKQIRRPAKAHVPLRSLSSVALSCA